MKPNEKVFLLSVGVIADLLFNEGKVIVKVSKNLSEAKLATEEPEQ